MGQFKPMVKMETTEPSVILKLKKGGKVAAKASMESGHKPMQNNAHAMHAAMHAEHGKSPKKPSMSERRRAMNPQMYKKGGKVAHKLDGGMMGAPAGMPPAMPPAMPAAPMRAAPAAMARPALAGMTPAQRAARAMMVRKALTGMKKGGAASSKCAALERELKHHESLSMSKAHKASGGSISKFVNTKVDDGDHHDKAHGTGKVKEGKPGGYAMGGTISGNAKKYENTKMNTATRDNAGGSTGGVRMGNAGGFKKGGNVSNWENRPADTAKKGKSNTTTGNVRLGNAGGFSDGGNASKKAYATGGIVNDGKAVKMPHHFVSRPVANSLQSGTFKKGGKVEKEEKPNLRLMKTHTGPKGHVAKVYKDRDWGEHRVKFYDPEGKHYKDADYHTDDKQDAHDTATGQLNRYKKGGSAKRFADGGISTLGSMLPKPPSGVTPDSPVYDPGLAGSGSGDAYSGLGKVRGGADDIDSALTNISKSTSDTQAALGSGGLGKSNYQAQLKRGGRVRHKENGGGMSAPRYISVEKEKVTTDVPNAANAARMLKEKKEKEMDRDTDKGERYFQDNLRAKKNGGSAGYAKGGDFNLWTKLNPTEKDKYNRVNAPAYSPSAVDKSIESSNRSGKKIGKSEASSIHRLLKGRY